MEWGGLAGMAGALRGAGVRSRHFAREQHAPTHAKHRSEERPLRPYHPFPDHHITFY